MKRAFNGGDRTDSVGAKRAGTARSEVAFGDSYAAVIFSSFVAAQACESG